MKAWLQSVASIFDFAGTFRDPRVDEILSRSDAEAIRSDWQAVGEDIHCAIHCLRRSENVCEPCAKIEAQR